jgi:alpha-tubulin suppressor-like RCC1 family protein
MTPQQVANFPTGTIIKSVAAGYAHFLALDSNGVLYSWGKNPSGQLGDGSKTARTNPTVVAGFPAGVTIEAIAAEFDSSFALGSDGTLYAWGDNPDGLLGVPTSPAQLTPAPVTGFPAGVNVDSFSAGGHSVQFADYAEPPGKLIAVVGAPNTLALGTDGNLYAWGKNASGQLGDGGTSSHASPIPVEPLPGGGEVSAVSEGGSHAVALSEYPLPDQVGLAFSVQPSGTSVGALLSPQPVVEVRVPPGDADPTFNGVVTLVLKGGPASAGLIGNPRATAVGGVASFSGLSLDSPGTYTLVAYSAGMDAVESAPFRISVAPSASGLYDWGYDFYGQLGNGDPKADRPFPVPVTALPTGVRIQSLTSGGVRTTAIGSDGGVYEWGLDSHTTEYYYEHGGGGGLCQPTFTDVENTAPVRVGGLPAGFTAAATATGFQHSLALDADGTVYRWGLIDYALTGYTSDVCPITTYYRVESPVVVTGFPAGTRIASIAAGGSLSAAVTDNGVVYTWGFADYTGTVGSNDPVAVSGFPAGVSARSVIVGAVNDYYALGSDGHVYHWVAGSTMVTPVIAAPAQATVKAISPLLGEVMALTSDGKVYTSDAPNTAVAGFPAGVTVTSIASSSSHALARGSDGRIYAWGTNDVGQLGLGDTANRAIPTPVNVFPGDTPIGAIVAAPGYSAALTAPPTNLLSALRIAAGMLGAGTNDMAGLNVVTSGGAAERIDLLDAVALARQRAGLSLGGTP